jgi:hypothetical protein
MREAMKCDIIKQNIYLSLTGEVLDRLEFLKTIIGNEKNKETMDLLNGAIEMVKKAEKKMSLVLDN